MADFLARIKTAGTSGEPRLHRADIFLSRGTKLFSYLIRRATGSQFSHAGLIFVVPSVEKGFDQAFVIEAVIGGVAIRPLQAKIRESEAVAILRFEPEWMDDDIRSFVRGHFLNYIDCGYRWELVWRHFCAFLFGIVAQFGSKKTRRQRITRAQRPRRQLPNSFICSGYVQFAFAAAIDGLWRANKIKATRGDAIFGRGLKADAANQALMTITPEDIAQSSKLAWKYMICRKRVHQVSGRDEALAVLRA